MRDRRIAYSGMAWNSVERIVLQFVQLGISIILARMLLPQEFGLIAMISIFISLADMVMQGGYRQTIIMRPMLSEIDFSTAFVYNIAVSIVMYVALFFFAPYIGDFYGEPQLVLLVRVLSVTLVLNAGYFIQDAMLQKDMRFRVLATRNILSSIISGIVAVVFAVMGFGVWSLVALYLTRSVVMNLYLWANSIWKLSLEFSMSSFKRSFGFGSRIMLTSITNVVVENLNNLVIGKFYTKTDLGYYYQARKLERIPVESASSIIGKTATPLLSRNSGNVIELQKVYMHLLKLISFFILPIIGYALVVSADLILLLFTEKWSDSIPVFRILLLGGVFYPYLVLNGQSPNVMGDSKFYLKLDTAYKVIRILFVLIAVRFSVLGFIIVQSSFFIVQGIGNSIVAQKFYYVALLK